MTQKGSPSHHLLSRVRLCPPCPKLWPKPFWDRSVPIPVTAAPPRRRSRGSPIHALHRCPLRGFPHCSSIKEGHFGFACNKKATLWTSLTSWQIFPVSHYHLGDLTRNSLGAKSGAQRRAKGHPGWNEGVQGGIHIFEHAMPLSMGTHLAEMCSIPAPSIPASMTPNINKTPSFHQYLQNRRWLQGGILYPAASP